MRYSWVVIALLWGCTKQQMDDCITSSGPDAVIERSIDDFTSLETTDKFKVVLFQDSTAADIIITGPRNLLGQITTKVEEGKLSLKNSNTCNFVRSFSREVEIRVNAPSLRKLIVNSASTVETAKQLELDELNILHQALSDIKLDVDVEGDLYVQSFNSSTTILSGQAGALKGSIEDVSDLDARDLLADEVLIDTHTPLDIYVNGKDILFIKIFNQGNVYYVSEPLIYKDLNVKSGSGDLIKL